MSSSVRSLISVEDQVDEVVADEEQRGRAGDERESHDRDGGAGQHFGDLTPAGSSNEDHAKHREEDRCDVAGEEADDALGVDALGLGGRSERNLLNRLDSVSGELGG